MCLVGDIVRTVALGSTAGLTGPAFEEGGAHEEEVASPYTLGDDATGHSSPSVCFWWRRAIAAATKGRRALDASTVLPKNTTSSSSLGE